MAKKGGVQQLQTEINTNDELTKFLDRDGLIVLDVFTEWCGPCLAMIGSLKKIKLEQGGDDLHLAVVKCDKIDAFERFRNKSEPTWLLASKGKLVNCAFGANVPHLIELILKELDMERRTRDTDPETSGRAYFELNEMTPIELERYNVIQKMEEENDRLEQESAQRHRIEYLTFVTDEIMKNSSDMGVTVLMPHVISRDLLKRLSDPADKCHLVAKDKKNAQILSDHIDVLEFCTTADSMPKHLVDHILNRDVFVICWKITDNNGDGEKNVEEYLSNFASFVWNEDPNTSSGNASILKALSVVIEVETNDDDDGKMNEENNGEIEKSIENADAKSGDEQDVEQEQIGENEANDDANGAAHQNESTTAAEEGETNAQMNENEDIQTEQSKEVENTSADDNDVSEEKSNKTDRSKSSERATPITPINSIKGKNQIEVKIPPIWTPSEKRTNAALIYLYFRSLTETYLPPDPPVERPHLALVFDAYKHREIMEVIDEHRDDVLAYGYFTTDNPETAQLIANSTFNYHKNPPTIYDKFILKVAKTKDSPVLAALKKLGPSYTSKNAIEGKVECLAFFPPGYKNSSETGETTPLPVDEKPKKKKKKRKNKQGSDEENENDNNQVQSVASQAPADVEATEPEDGTEQDDDDSVDDEDSAEGNDTENLPETTET